jgi:hypothetical protein
MNKEEGQLELAVYHALEGNARPRGLRITEGRDSWMVRYEITDCNRDKPIYFRVAKQAGQTNGAVVIAAILLMGAHTQAARSN